MTFLPLASSYGKAASLKFNSAELCNLCAMPGEGVAGRSPYYLEATPGLQQVRDTGPAPVRMLARLGTSLYAVAGTRFGRIGRDGTFTDLGEVTGGLPCARATVQGQLLVLGDAEAFTYDAATGALAQVDSTGYAIADTVAAQNQRFILNKRGTGQYFWSSLANGRQYDPLDVATAEGNDDSLVAVFAGYDLILLFGQETNELVRWDGFGYSRIPGGIIDIGLAGRLAATRLDNTVFWLGHTGFIYAMAGASAQIISPQPIVDAVAEMVRVDDCEAFATSVQGHLFVRFTFPTAGRTFVYNIRTGLWHEETLHYRQPVACYGGLYAGDMASGKIWRVATGAFDAAGQPIRRKADLAVILDGVNGFAVERLELLLDTGMVGASGGAAQVMLSWSTDGGRTFGNRLQGNAGDAGQHRQRVAFHNLGLFPLDARFRVEMSAALPWRLLGADVMVRGSAL